MANCKKMQLIDCIFNGNISNAIKAEVLSSPREESSPNLFDGINGRLIEVTSVEKT